MNSTPELRPPIPPSVTPGSDEPQAKGVATKSPLIAALLSMFPGMGNIYNGLYLRGLIFFLIIVSLMGVADRGHELFGFVVAFFWIFNVIDAYRQATLINYGYAQDLGLTDLPKRPKAGQGGLLAGIILLVIGLVALLDQYFHIDLDWLIELWPVALMLIGAWLIWAAIRERLQERAAERAEIDGDEL